MKKLHAICTQFFLFLSVYLYICSVNDSFLLVHGAQWRYCLKNSLSPSGASLRKTAWQCQETYDCWQFRSKLRLNKIGMHDFALDLHWIFAKEMLKNIRCSNAFYRKKFVTLQFKRVHLMNCLQIDQIRKEITL